MEWCGVVWLAVAWCGLVWHGCGKESVMWYGVVLAKSFEFQTVPKNSKIPSNHQKNLKPPKKPQTTKKTSNHQINLKPQNQLQTSKHLTTLKQTTSDNPHLCVLCSSTIFSSSSSVCEGEKTTSWM